MRVPLVFLVALFLRSAQASGSALLKTRGALLEPRGPVLKPRASNTPIYMNFYYICPYWNTPTTNQAVHNMYERGAGDIDNGIFACTFYTFNDGEGTYNLADYDTAFYCLYSNVSRALDCIFPVQLNYIFRTMAPCMVSTSVVMTDVLAPQSHRPRSNLRIVSQPVPWRIKPETTCTTFTGLIPATPLGTFTASMGSTLIRMLSNPPVYTIMCVHLPLFLGALTH
jgi:hypothetical protein